VAVTHDAVATIRQLCVLPHGDERVGFGDPNLSQHSAGTFACKLGQGFVNRVRLTE